MTSMSSRLLMLAVAASLVGATAACGGGSTPATSAPTTVAATSVAPTGGNADQFWPVVRNQKALLQGTQLAGLLTGGTPAGGKACLAQPAAMNQQLVDTAPPEVKANVKTLQ